MTEKVIPSLRYFYVDQETGAGSAWGTEPTTPVLVHYPFKSVDIKMQKPVLTEIDFDGRYQLQHAQSAGGKIPQGTIVTPFYGIVDSTIGTKSLAQYIFEMALGDGSTITQESGDRPSFSLYDIQKGGAGTELSSKIWNGLRINKFTVKGTMNGFIEITLDVMGKTWSALGGAAAAIPADRNKLVRAIFPDTVFTLGGSTFPISEFELSVEFGLKPLFLTGATAAGSSGGGPSDLDKVGRTKTKLTIKPVKLDSTYDAFQKLLTMTELAAVLNIQGLHNGTGASGDYTKVALTLARCSLENADEGTFAPEDYAFQPLTFNVLKPQSSANQIAPVWSLV